MSGSIDLKASLPALWGAWFGANLGPCAGPGDLDGDGLADIVIGASGVSANVGVRSAAAPVLSA